MLFNAPLVCDDYASLAASELDTPLRFNPRFDAFLSVFLSVLAIDGIANLPK